MSASPSEPQPPRPRDGPPNPPPISVSHGASPTHLVPPSTSTLPSSVRGDGEKRDSFETFTGVDPASGEDVDLSDHRDARMRSANDESLDPLSPESPIPQSDYYALLGIDRTSSPQTIKKAYRREALKLHPDKNLSDPKAADRFQRIATAYQVLSNPKKRLVYDNYGERGVALMSTVPFLDPDVMLAVNRVAILSFLFSVFVFCFPILIALRVDGKISGKWVLIFFPAFGAILVLLILTVWTAVYGKDNSDPVDLDDDDDPKLEPRKASSVVARIAIVILKILYVVLIAVLFVLFALQLDGVINAWPAVFAPWFIMEVYHVVYATTVLLDSFESGKVVPWAAAVAEAPQSMDGDDSYLYVTRPFTTFEKMSEIFCAYQGIIFRMAQVALVVLKLSNPTYMSWTEAFVPTYILGVTVFIALALSWWNMSTTALAPPSQSNSAYASDARAVAIANLVLVAVCFTLVATSLGLLVTRLSRESSLPLEAAPVPTATATDTATGAAAVSTPPGTPPAGVILIPVFLLTSLVFCCLGVCLPFGLCVGRLGLKAELARSATPTASTASSPEGNEGGLSASSLRGLEKGKGRATAAASAASAAGEDFGESGPLIGRDKGGW